MTTEELTITIPISDTLIRDALNRGHVAQLAGKMASEAAQRAVYNRGRELDEEERKG